MTSIVTEKAGYHLEDNGPGVPKESIEKLFDIFYRSDSSRTDYISKPFSPTELVVIQQLLDYFALVGYNNIGW